MRIGKPTLLVQLSFPSFIPWIGIADLGSYIIAPLDEHLAHCGETLGLPGGVTVEAGHTFSTAYICLTVTIGLDRLGYVLLRERLERVACNLPGVRGYRLFGDFDHPRLKRDIQQAE